jgi:hypothetical protein
LSITEDTLKIANRPRGEQEKPQIFDIRMAGGFADMVYNDAPIQGYRARRKIGPEG